MHFLLAHQIKISILKQIFLANLTLRIEKPKPLSSLENAKGIFPGNQALILAESNFL